MIVCQYYKYICHSGFHTVPVDLKAFRHTVHDDGVVAERRYVKAK